MSGEIETMESNPERATTMQTEAITIDAKTARDLYREYRKHQHYSAPIDDEIRRAYHLLAQGRLVIRALESIRKAGLNEQGLPKLAIQRATSPQCFFRSGSDGSCSFADTQWSREGSRNRIVFPAATFAFPRHRWDAAEALIPPIPVHLRPKRGLANYHVLWEAEWTRVVPRDPYLLRRIGKTDMWLVAAMWDLTEVERAALASRITPQ